LLLLLERGQSVAGARQRRQPSHLLTSKVTAEQRKSLVQIPNENYKIQIFNGNHLEFEINVI
jgi:hypothetical protein